MSAASRHPDINVELLDMIVRQIEDTPDHWEQDSWTNQGHDVDGHPCKTTFCIAGWAAFLTDHVDGYGKVTEKGREWAARHRGFRYDELGRELLGLDQAQSDVLFGAYAFSDLDNGHYGPKVELLRPVIKERLGVDLGPPPKPPRRKLMVEVPA